MSSFKEVMSSASRYTTENLIIYSVILYTLTGDYRVILFGLGLVINVLLYMIIRKDNFPSLSMQTTMFFLSYVITINVSQVRAGGDMDINPLFILIIVGLSYLISIENNTSFSAIVVSTIIGICSGIIYAWLIHEYNVKESNDTVNLMGAPYSDYSKCETVEERDLPIKIEKERQINKNKCL